MHRPVQRRPAAAHVTSRNYITGCGFDRDPTTVCEDNTAVIRYARDIGLAHLLRSLNQHLHFGRQQQQFGVINVL